MLCKVPLRFLSFLPTVLGYLLRRTAVCPHCVNRGLPGEMGLGPRTAEQRGRAASGQSPGPLRPRPRTPGRACAPCPGLLGCAARRTQGLPPLRRRLPWLQPSPWEPKRDEASGRRQVRVRRVEAARREAEQGIRGGWAGAGDGGRRFPDLVLCYPRAFSSGWGPVERCLSDKRGVSEEWKVSGPVGSWSVCQFP